MSAQESAQPVEIDYCEHDVPDYITCRQCASGSPRRQVLTSRLLDVLNAHSRCGVEATVEVHEDKTGTMHYPCGATVGEVRGLANADRKHLADALACEALAALSGGEGRG